MLGITNGMALDLFFWEIRTRRINTYTSPRRSYLGYAVISHALDDIPGGVAGTVTPATEVVT